MMGLPSIFFLSIAVWFGVLVLATYLGVRRRFTSDERWQPYLPFHRILVFTLLFPIIGLPVAWFDDYAVRWFHEGTGRGFMAVELGVALAIWLMIALLIAWRKGLRGALNWFVFAVIFAAVALGMFGLWASI